MKKPIKICENPECKEEFNTYKSAKRKHCCDSCRQRSNYLKRNERNRGFKKIEQDYKQQYELINFLSKHAKRPISLDLLDQLEFDPKLYTKREDVHGRPVYDIQDKSISINPEKPQYIFIKQIIKRKVTSI
jgi:hypothetical protein